MSIDDRRPIPGWENRYAVTASGRVYSLPRWKSPHLIELNQYRDSAGYPYVSLSKNGRNRRQRVHALVLLTFVGPRPDGYFCCHNDGNPANNHVDNLRWDTPSSNVLDRVRHGTHNHANKTHCPQEHPYSFENTLVTRSGGRLCRTCRREQGREYERQQKLTYGACPDCGIELHQLSLRAHLRRRTCLPENAGPGRWPKKPLPDHDSVL